MKKLEKKQIPQFAALCVLSAGLFGYFVLRLISPSPAAAGTRSPQLQPAPAKAAAPSVDKNIRDKKADAALNTTPVVTDTGTDTGAPPPSPGMHDPFVVGYVDPKTLPAKPGAPALPNKPAVQVASIHGVAPVLPLGLQGFPVQPLPSSASSSQSAAVVRLPTAPKLPPPPPAAPTWSVTGVLEGDQGQIAVLRNGEARRIVRSGDFVDSIYRVVNVTRTMVVLRHGTAVYKLPLGGAKTVTAKAPLAAPAAVLPTASPTADAASAPASQTDPASWQQMMLLN